MLSALSRLLTLYLQWHGFTCGMDDLLLVPRAEDARQAVSISATPRWQPLIRRSALDYAARPASHRQGRHAAACATSRRSLAAGPAPCELGKACPPPSPRFRRRCCAAPRQRRSARAPRPAAPRAATCRRRPTCSRRRGRGRRSARRRAGGARRGGGGSAGACSCAGACDPFHGGSAGASSGFEPLLSATAGPSAPLLPPLLLPSTRASRTAGSCLRRWAWRTRWATSTGQTGTWPARCTT